MRIIYTIAEEEAAKTPSSSDWTGETGYIDKAMLTKYLTREEIPNSIFYICGPPAMLNAMQQLLSKEIGVYQDRMKIEVFTGY